MFEEKTCTIIFLPPGYSPICEHFGGNYRNTAPGEKSAMKAGSTVIIK